jgi:hypothetical protein
MAGSAAGPSPSTSANLDKDAGTAWPYYRGEVLTTLATSPQHAVLFALPTFNDPARLGSRPLPNPGQQSRVGAARQGVRGGGSPRFPAHPHQAGRGRAHRGQHPALLEHAARRLTKMHKLVASSDRAVEVDHLIAELREAYRLRPRLKSLTAAIFLTHLLGHQPLRPRDQFDDARLLSCRPGDRCLRARAPSQTVCVFPRVSRSDAGLSLVLSRIWSRVAKQEALFLSEEGLLPSHGSGGRI